MAFTNRLSSLLVPIAVALAIGGCGSTNNVAECGNGVFCPQGFHCAAAEPVCIEDKENCGNGIMDGVEVCDDGNTIDDDGCNRECDSTNVCGNGVRDVNVGELCDDGDTIDGNVVNGKRCSKDCKSLEVCGNGITDFGEICDDANDIVGDGCSQQCQSLEVCGNMFMDPGEACEPPNTAECNADCTSTLACNNGELDPLEECDELGKTEDNRDCRSDCIANRCGDGYTNELGPFQIEECDGAPRAREDAGDPRQVIPTDTAACDSDCTLPSCGDGTLNRAFRPDGAPGTEQCDDGPGLNLDRRDCTAHCQVNRCGDQKINLDGPAHPETCDDGDQVDTNACTNECKAAACGDGIVRTVVEQCDDDNEVSGDGCSQACVKEFCGDGVPNNETPNTHEDCDGPGVTATCNANCTTARCGDGIVNPLFTKPGAVGPEQCDPPSATNGCSADCRFEQCGNNVTDPGEECDDGDQDAGDGCFACHFERCGNGILDVGEQCDDGNNLDTDSCISSSLITTSCKLARCGDNHRRVGIEDCDNGLNNGLSGNACSATCQTVTCGNGVLEQDEECDDGNASNTDDCVTILGACKIATCGDTHTNSAGGLVAREECDDGDTDSGDGCSATCRVEECGNAIIDPLEECDNGLGNNNNNSDCRADCILNRCGDGHTNTTGDVPEQCDDAPDAPLKSTATIVTETATCNKNCRIPTCGDNIVNPLFTATTLGATAPEQCDPPSPGNGCSAACQFELCGNEFEDVTEQCDEGLGNANSGVCTLACRDATCGDGFLLAAGPTPEQCDPAIPLTQVTCPYNVLSLPCTICNSLSCQQETATAPFCGDGNTDLGEELCDDRNTTCGACGNTCDAITSAHATGLMFAGTGIVEDDTLTVDDGIGTPVTFTFVDDSPGALEIRIENPTQTAQNIANAINGSGLLITATPSGLIVTLLHQRATSRANSGVGTPRITFDVSTDNVAVIDMSGGLGGDCDDDEACREDKDCASNNCVDNVCESPDPGILTQR
jgi:cysteine-rich repeat protein